MSNRIEISVNGEPREVDVKPHWNLLYVLRKKLGLTGVKYGCGTGECGACSVIMDGKVVHSCVKLAAQCDGSEVTTIEGLSTGSDLSKLQTSFVNHGAVQCGYCMPGMVLSAHVLLNEKPNPTEHDVREILDGNLCRCTGYQKIIDAILDVESRR
jgi:carbon-monoxide dehydrogenase small subunit